MAPDLLEAVLSHETSEGTVGVRLTEVEAYAGESDAASHAFRGPTPRNAVMFGVAGHAYVYRSHGLHWCLNVVTGRSGTASAVLLRAGEVVVGADLARWRRGEPKRFRDLARGPGNLAQAIGVTSVESGADLLGSSSLSLRLADSDASLPIVVGPRVGVTQAANVPWRFWIEDDPSVSQYRRSPRATSNDRDK